MNEFTQWLLDIVGSNPEWAYVFLFVAAVVDNLVPPIPGDVVLVFAGYLAGIDSIRLRWIFSSTVAGHISGYMLVYWLGRRFGRRFIRAIPWLRKSDPWIDRAERYALRHGVFFVALNRFMPGIRTVIAATVGLLRMRWWVVFMSALFSIVIWNGLLIWSGVVLGRNWDDVVTLLRDYNIIAGILIAIVFVSVGFWFNKKRKLLRSESLEANTAITRNDHLDERER